METISTDYNIQMYPLPWIDPLPETPVIVKIYITHLLKLQLRSPQGYLNTNYPTITLSDFEESFTIPRHVFFSMRTSDLHIFHRLSQMGLDPNLFNPLRQSIINSIFDPSWRRFGNLRGIQVIARVNVTTTTELLSEQATSYDQMVSMFAVADEVVIMEDVGGSVQRRGMGVSKAAIDGLKKVLVFKDEKCTRTCPVCLEEFGEGTEVTSMPCCHLFHHGCIVPWLKSHNSCPMCRYQIQDP
ncbi:hypothetical protein CsSME_00039283 [Camellia sinensis var. sinensis]